LGKFGEHLVTDRGLLRYESQNVWTRLADYLGINRYFLCTTLGIRKQKSWNT